MLRAERPQLRMRHRLAELPKEIELPEGYRLRLATPDDAAGLAHLLQLAYGYAWDAAGTKEILLRNAEVPKTFLIEADEIVATASYQVKGNEFPEAGWIHFVAVAPTHQGMRLGYIVSRAVLAECVANERTDAWLTTDDHRLPAIRTYFRLGFEPDPWHDRHPVRWEKVLSNLAS
jgi:GNAT superfamily N-acetyltransferase